MDTLRDNFGSLGGSDGYDAADDEPVREAPPAAIGQDERRMQVRAYNHWASLLTERNYPAIEDLEPENLPDFGPHSVLLDFTAGIENPGIAYLGALLGEECGAEGENVQSLADVPSRSLLSRITDHYMQILANQAPIGFEAEFLNQRGATILYRGILLPFSSDDDTIDFIYGVINWKELADQQASDELLLEIDQALEPKPAPGPGIDPLEALTDWADGPLAEPANDVEPEEDELEADDASVAQGAYAALEMLPRPAFGLDRKRPLVLEEAPLDFGVPADWPPMAYTGEPAPPAEPVEMALGDWLAAARELAAAARTSEDRTRNALYEAIGRAYDFSLAAAEAPEEFAELLEDAGLTMQERAPMTPVVKLVFGADYDKTRLTEYAAALSLARRLDLPRGAFGAYLAQAEGGLKGVVKAERQLRREESGKPVAPSGSRDSLAGKLRAMPPREFAAIPPYGSEFALVMIRRTDAGAVIVLGEVPEDAGLMEKAARRLVG
jgi:hypothetical protein